MVCIMTVIIIMVGVVYSEASDGFRNCTAQESGIWCSGDTCRVYHDHPGEFVCICSPPYTGRMCDDVIVDHGTDYVPDLPSTSTPRYNNADLVGLTALLCVIIIFIATTSFIIYKHKCKPEHVYGSYMSQATTPVVFDPTTSKFTFSVTVQLEDS